MKSKNSLSLTQKNILNIVEEYDGLLSITKIAKKLGKSLNTVFPNIRSLESQRKLIETRRIGRERIVYFIGQDAYDASAEVSVRLIKMFKLDELEFRILTEVKDGESIQGAAEKLGVLPMQVDARIRSILAKFEVKTFAEAKKSFSSARKNLRRP